MATGRKQLLNEASGRDLVGAELSRRGYIATTFIGNVPFYDIIAVDDSAGHAVVQVKASAGASWQFNATNFADIVMKGHKQIIRCARKEPLCGLARSRVSR